MDDAFGNWLAGLIDGEGAFTIQRDTQGSHWCRFRLGLRDDDRPILEEIQARAGFGVVRANRAQSGNRNPIANWTVETKADCAKLVALLERYPLRAKKARDFAIWREAVEEWLTVRGPGYPHDWTLMAGLREHLTLVRQYGDVIYGVA